MSENKAKKSIYDELYEEYAKELERYEQSKAKLTEIQNRLQELKEK